MADIRPTGASIANLPTAPRGAARADSVRAAQAAFFQSALQETSASADTPVRPAPAAAKVAFDASAPQPERILRPGSLVDLKV